MSIDIGFSAPDFTLPVDGGGQATLSAFRGRPVVLYFYPKDDTSGCTKEACAFRDLIDEFKLLQVEIIGVSKDGVVSHDKFKIKHSLPFLLASDKDSDVVERYGFWVQKSMYGRVYMGIERATVLIDAEGVIRQIWRKVKITGHVEQVLKAVRALS
ncbi:putative peroxiredoxin bcp [Azospirillaceae bacterium]